MKDALPSIKILGTKVTRATKTEILEYIFKSIEKSAHKFYIVTPNPEILVYATRSSSYQDILNGAEVSLADGVGVLLAGRMQKKAPLDRITGVDMMEVICAEASKRAVTVGFLGGRDGVAEMTAECLTKKYPQLRVNFVGEEWPQGSRVKGQWSITRSTKMKSTSSTIHQSSFISHIDILFVAFGFPRQEEWIAKNLDKLPVTVAMGVGGAFDYVSGKVPRAPKAIRDAGLEWAFRLVRQPWRAKRQLALPVFAYHVLKEKFSS